MMAGVLLFAMGSRGIGALIRFIPVSIVIGFTSGIAVLIALSQVRDSWAWRSRNMPANFFSQICDHPREHPRSTGSRWSSALVLAADRLHLAKVRQWQARRHARPAWTRGLVGTLPGTIVALVVATLAVALLRPSGGNHRHPLRRHSAVHCRVRASRLQLVDGARLLVAPTLTIALLGAIESLLCARVADNMINDRHDPNQELMAQGIANMVAPAVRRHPRDRHHRAHHDQCARWRAARRSPASCTRSTLLIVVLVAAPLAAHIPLAALAAILLFVAFNMGEWDEFRRLRTSRSVTGS